MKRVNQMLTILSYSNMQCLQNEDFTYWGGKLRLQCAKHDSPPEKQAPSTTLQVSFLNSGKDAEPNNASSSF